MQTVSTKKWASLATSREMSIAILFALVGWAIGAAAMWLTFWVWPVTTGFAVRSIVAPAAFYLVSMEYFRRRSGLGALLVAVTFASVELTADAAVALVFGSRVYDIPRSLPGTWLPAALIFVVAWTVGIGLGPQRGASST